jgi:hypothetical protein
MIEAVFPLLFGILLTMVLVWFGLLARLFRTLRADHPATYERLGSPTLIYNNSLKNNWLLFRFLYRNEFNVLGDMSLGRFCRWLKIFLAGYLVLFFVMLGLVLIIIVTVPLPRTH